MGLISFVEARSGVNDPQMWINTLLESTNFTTKSGVNITADTALNISTVYACITILSQTIASLPMTINRRLPGGGNEVSDDHHVYPILHDSFNTEQTSYESREMGIGHLKLRGNWYNLIERDGTGRIMGIWPLNPAGMAVTRLADGNIIYQYTSSSEERWGQRTRYYFPNEIWHIKGFSKNGLTGLSTISYARESMGLAAGLRDYSSQFFGNKTVIGDILRHPGQLNVESRENLKQSLGQYKNTNRHGTLILEEGMEWQNMGITNVDAQFLEISGAQVRDIARWFHVPLILLQEPDKTSTYASAEQFMLSFVVHTISPIVVRIEQSANRALLTDQERQQGYYIKLNMNSLLRGDFKTRMEGYRIAREGGWQNADEIRALEDMPPIPDEKGQIYLQPMNFKELGEEVELPNNFNKMQEGEEDADTETKK